ncbi:BMC domain-containing protein [Desulfosediminicola ganghwensis]|uniref:BMC domain-containing protein n=1 Tax=Desulfosediminicola ganghwensis TaxID=2569540 RepID=UPI0010AC15C6
MDALGFIETKGLLAAVEAADAMVKAAAVRLIEKNLVGAGLVTITVSGEVSAVRASVDAGVTAVNRIQGAVLVSQHVIARPYEEMATLIGTGGDLTPPALPSGKDGGGETASEQASDSTAQPDEIATAAQDEAPKAATVEKTGPKKEEPAPTKTGVLPISGLKRLTVSKLRQIALGLSGISLTELEIRKATKKKLIEAIVTVTDR